jgi:hypothetical protein
MAIIPSKLDGYTPVCSDCGIALCWDISEAEYQDKRQFWDNWQCDICNPQIKGSWLRLEAAQQSGLRTAGNAGLKFVISTDGILPLKVRGAIRRR